MNKGAMPVPSSPVLCITPCGHFHIDTKARITDTRQFLTPTPQKNGRGF